MITQETKWCSDCEQEKPISRFYTHSETGKPEKRCKDCKRRLQRSYKQHGVKKSAIPHEQEIINKLRSMGIYACSGKKSRSRWVDIVAFGCVAIEAKRSRTGTSAVNFAFTKKQAEKGIRGDIVIFMVEHDNKVSYHLLRSNNPVLHNSDGSLKRWINYTPGSNHRKANHDMMDAMADGLDNWGLVLKVLNEKIQAMKQGKNVDKFADY